MGLRSAIDLAAVVSAACCVLWFSPAATAHLLYWNSTLSYSHCFLRISSINFVLPPELRFEFPQPSVDTSAGMRALASEVTYVDTSEGASTAPTTYASYPSRPAPSQGTARHASTTPPETPTTTAVSTRLPSDLGRGSHLDPDTLLLCMSNLFKVWVWATLHMSWLKMVYGPRRGRHA
eukprot:gene19190-25805_t